ncbi:MAG: phosphoribosylformylglycinamidine synthase subunit PurS [Armatimonadetes bacterium]|nr:phosphoribosylformylglycinamidine synthase subunit PurS [Armatimonadota bacterium]
MAQVKVYVTLKPALLDAQGKVVQGALQQLGYEDVTQVRVGKYIEMTVADGTRAPAVEAQVKEMCDRLLANPVIEDYKFEVEA